MADSRIFNLEEGMTAETIGLGIESFFRDKKKMLAEGMVTTEGYLVQAKEEAGWKKFTGMDQATQVQIFQISPTSINVSVGTGSWVDKAAAAGVGAVVFAPLMATAAFGAYKQQKLPNEIFEHVEYFIATGGKSYGVSMQSSISAVKLGKVSCPNCHAQNDEGTKFCSSCGTALGETCPNCSATVGIGTKFCPDCGTDLQAAKEKNCDNCGAILNPEAKFCPECGTPA